MKLTLILLIAFVLHAGARGTAQTVTLSVKNMPLEKICKEIERQTGYYFVYAKDLNKETHLVSVKLNGVSMDEALRQVFQGLPFRYQVIDKVIVVNTMTTSNPHARISTDPGDQMIKVQGVVLTEQGQPLAEASVTIKANGKGTITNAKGEFSLPAIPANTELLITHIGYSSKSVLPREGKFLEVQLSIAASELDANVVKGYYSTSNRLNTGNVVTVKGEDIAKQPVTDPILALEGRVPGLSISQTSGVPGSYSTIQLRGQNSIRDVNKPVTVNDPLYIVDGVPFSSQSLTDPLFGGGVFQAPTYNNGTGQGISPFNGLNPADIESIEILKDADATAIYGSRGANGVILINTKKGKVGQTKMDINVYTGVGKVARKLDLMNTQQYLQMRHEAYRNDNLSLVTLPAYDLNGFWDTTRYTDWQKVLIDNPAPFTNAQANISGGNVNTQYLIGGGYSRQGVLFPGNYSDEKASLHINISNSSPDQRFHTQLYVNYINDNNNEPIQNLVTSITLAPNAPALYDANGNLNWQPKNGSATWANPLAYTNAHAKANFVNLIGNLVMRYQVFSGFNLQSSFGYANSQLNGKVLQPSSYFPPPNDIPGNRSSSFSSASNTTWIIEPQANYLRQIAKGRLEVLVGCTFQDNTQNSQSLGTANYSSDALISNPMAAGLVFLGGYSYAQYRYNAVFGRINYSWQDKYLINITARRDGSSRFGAGKQFGNFGAVGAAWIFSKEMFIQNNFPLLSFGKFRASYGITGNDQIGDYRYLSTYSADGKSYQNLPGLYPLIIANPYFGWERVKKLEGGVELGFLKDRIIFAMSWYRNRTDNQLVFYPLPLVTGFGGIQGNLPALIQNTGLEFTVQTINLRSKNFNWNSSVNLSIPRNKLLAYPDIQNSPYKYNYVVGQPLSIRYLFHYTGVDPQTGTYQVLTKSGNAKPFLPEDYVPSKPITQSYYGGVQNTLTYKGFQLEFLIQFVKQLGYNYLGGGIDIPGKFNVNQPTFVLSNRWQKRGDIATVQRYTNGFDPARAAYDNVRLSDNIISDASFVRLKTLACSYQLPTEWLKKAQLKYTRVYIQCQNLLTITNYLGLDPETGFFSLPPVRMITAGIQVNF